MSTQNKNLAGQVALVTGASTGIGRGIALALAAQGASVVVNYHNNETAAREVVAQIKALANGADAVPVRGDVADLPGHTRLVAAAMETFGRLDLLVNNAGIGIRRPALETTPEDWDRVMSLNLKGLYFLTQAAARAMLPRRSGKIINISSVHDTRAMPGNSVYCASKAALTMLTQAFALEFASHGIAVIGVSPGAIRTEATAVFLADPEYEKRVLAKIPQNRIGDVADIGDAVAWLASPQCRYLTGVTLTIDGGMLLL